MILKYSTTRNQIPSSRGGMRGGVDGIIWEMISEKNKNCYTLTNLEGDTHAVIAER